MGRIKTDTLLIIPQLTAQTPLRVRTSLKALSPSVKVVELAGVSHDLYVEEPQRLADLVEKFLKSQAPIKFV